MIIDNKLSRIIYDAAINNDISIEEAENAYNNLCLFMKEHFENEVREDIKITYFGKFKYNEKHFNKLTEIRDGKSDNSK